MRQPLDLCQKPLGKIFSPPPVALSTWGISIVLVPQAHFLSGFAQFCRFSKGVLVMVSETTSSFPLKCVQLLIPSWSSAAAPAHRDALHRPGERSAGRSEPLTTRTTRNLWEWAGGASPPGPLATGASPCPRRDAFDLVFTPVGGEQLWYKV